MDAGFNLGLVSLPVCTTNEFQYISSARNGSSRKQHITTTSRPQFLLVVLFGTIVSLFIFSLSGRVEQWPLKYEASFSYNNGIFLTTNSSCLLRMNNVKVSCNMYDESYYIEWQ